MMTRLHPDITEYPPEAVKVAEAQGWDKWAHSVAIYGGDIDEIGSTHPFLFLTEEQQVELWESWYADIW